jgi:PleD family two-component response regulator
VVETKKKLLIVEDDIDVAEMLEAYFRVQGYDVEMAHLGKDAIAFCINKRPDLVILDIRLPDIDGFEVARLLKSKQRTLDIPIIFLTEKRSKLDVINGLELGVDDYITKPFDIQELRLRVKNSLQNLDARPSVNLITGMPDGILVEERLLECLETENCAIIMLSLGNFDRFRESFDFLTVDDILKAVGLLIQNSIRKKGNISDFVGHFQQSETFVVVTKEKNAKSLKTEIEIRLEKYQDFFYPLGEKTKANVHLQFLLKVVKPVEDSIKNFSELKESLKT